MKQPRAAADLQRRIAAEQIEVHYRQMPAIVIAPLAGAILTLWILWDAEPRSHLLIGLAAVAAVSTVRLLMYRRYFAASPQRRQQALWQHLAIGAAFVAGCIWGGVATFLYPPDDPDYEAFLLILMALVPIVPSAALATYVPAFYAYFVPCVAQIVAVLALRGRAADELTAVLALAMMAAMAAFAHRFSRQLTEAIRLRIELAEKSQALHDALQQKSRFIAAASHDLRDPVAAMSLFMASMRQGGTPLERGQGMAHVESALANLSGMLENLLEVSALDTGQLVAHPREFDVGEVLTRLGAEFAPRARLAGLRFRLRVQHARVHSDPDLLERMLRNLLSNALRFTRRGQIALLCRKRHGTLQIQVLDTGPGIDAGDLERIFEEFTQVDDPGRRAEKGLGLGLAIVRRLARLLDHTLELRSVVGRGSAFSIGMRRGTVLPARHAPPVPTRAQASAARGAVLLAVTDAVSAEGVAAQVRQLGYAAVRSAGIERSAAALRGGLAAPRLLIVERCGDVMSALQTVQGIARLLGRPLAASIVAGDPQPRQVRACFDAGFSMLGSPLDPGRLRAFLADALGPVDGQPGD